MYTADKSDAGIVTPPLLSERKGLGPVAQLGGFVQRIALSLTFLLDRLLEPMLAARTRSIGLTWACFVEAATEILAPWRCRAAPNRIVLLRFENIDAVKGWWDGGGDDIEKKVGSKYPTFRTTSRRAASMSAPSSRSISSSTGSPTKASPWW